MHESVHASVALPPLTHKARHGNCMVLSGIPAILIHHANVQLYSSMLLRRNNPVRCRTLSWNVQVHHLAFFVLHVANKYENKVQQLSGLVVFFFLEGFGNTKRATVVSDKKKTLTRLTRHRRRHMKASRKNLEKP
eukprot:GHVS01000061.1.p1 GENE.GHVS01000061.1~~GHVS01000061.1.p1  ORF type:complete len:135 (-),score=11.38 GHVS01000061.1:329-733(-)